MEGMDRRSKPRQLAKLDVEAERSKHQVRKEGKGKAKTKSKARLKTATSSASNNVEVGIAKATLKSAAAEDTTTARTKNRPTTAGSSPTKVAVAHVEETVSSASGAQWAHKPRATSAPPVRKTPDTSIKAASTIPPAVEMASKYSSLPSGATQAIGIQATVTRSNSQTNARAITTPTTVVKQLATESSLEPPVRGMYHELVETRQCETLCAELGLTVQHLRKMKRKFAENDMYHTYVPSLSFMFCAAVNEHIANCFQSHRGEITQPEFFFIISEDERPLTRGILRYANVTKDQRYLSFDEYLRCVVSFAALTPRELYEFVFTLYDSDGSGSLDDKEFAKMSQEMQSKQFSFPKNVAHAIQSMITSADYRAAKCEDGLVDVDDFMQFARLCPVAFYPIFNFQMNVRRATLGEAYWSHLVGRKLKVQELVKFMRNNHGAQPEMTWRDHVWNTFSGDLAFIRQRAAEIYAEEVAWRPEINGKQTS